MCVPVCYLLVHVLRAAHQAYQRINIRVVIKGIEFWSNEDYVKYENNGGTDVRNFATFRKNVLIPRAGPNDNAHLLR